MLIIMQHCKVTLADLKLYFFFPQKLCLFLCLQNPRHLTIQILILMELFLLSCSFLMWEKMELQNCLGWEKKNSPSFWSPTIAPSATSRLEPKESWKTFSIKEFSKFPPLAQFEFLVPCFVVVPEPLGFPGHFLFQSFSAAKPTQRELWILSPHPPRFNDLCTSKPD